MPKTLAVKNWSEFQHYKDRSPSWIKLHKRILDDRVFHLLPVASRALAPMIWLLASEHEGGVLPFDLGDFAYRLRQTEKEIENAVNPLIDKGFLILAQTASEPLAEGLQVAIPRREEKRREENINQRREETTPQKSIEALFELPHSVNQELWEAYRDMRKKKRAPMTDKAREIIIRKLVAWEKQGHDVNAILEKSISSNWTDVFLPKDAMPSQPVKPRTWAPVTELVTR
jgi:flagellar biosynthesis GTPase FlhF